MKRIFTLVAASLISIIAVNPAFADKYDANWVAKCVKDNNDQSVSVEVITNYCTCMNGLMSSDETQSVTAWEKTHAKEREDCSKKAGWK